MSSEQSPDLWPANLLESQLVSPLLFLNSQAALVRAKTQKHLIGEVVALKSDASDIRNYGFALKAPGLKGYVFPLFKVSYRLSSIYPITLESRQIKGEDGDKYRTWEIPDGAALTRVVTEILGHETTINAVRALLAESLAMGYDPDEKVPF